MKLTIEKEELIRRICEEEDRYVIQAIKDLLDHPESTWPVSNDALDRELDISLAQANNGEEVSAEEVLAEFRKKYAA